MMRWLLVIAALGASVWLAWPNAHAQQTFVLQGEPGAPACGDDPCQGTACVLQGAAATACSCQP